MTLTKTFEFNSTYRVRLMSVVKAYNDKLIKNEPMMYSANKEFAYDNGGPLTKQFIEKLSATWKDDFIIDSRVHMLMPGWYPCIPGWHHDDVPRSLENGQPNYYNPEYHAEHCMMLLGDCSLTSFASGKQQFQDVVGENYYKVWNDEVDKMINEKKLRLLKSEIIVNRLVFFDCHTWHRGNAATKDGWRFFIRASRNTNRPFHNEIRRQVQVYLNALTEGW